MQRMTKRKYSSADFGKKALFMFYQEEGGTQDSKMFLKIIKEFFTGIGRLIVLNNLWFKMPHGLGSIRVQEKEVKQKIVDGKVVHNLRMDFNATKQLWAKDPKAKEEGRRIYHLNEHTDGYAYKIKWERPTKMNMKTHYINGIWAYLFKANRNMTQLLAHTLKDPDIQVKYFR